MMMLQPRTLLFRIVSLLDAFRDPVLKEELGTAKSIEMHLTLNGHEVSLRSFLNQFQEHHDRMLKEAAEKLLQHRLGKLHDAIYKVEREAANALLDIPSE